MQKLIVAVCCILLSTSNYAQRFGGTPPGVKWKQIDTDTARIIFPAGLDSQAQRVASIIHQQASVMPGSLHGLKKINIVLQNQTVISNGYVGLGPYRSEFYLNPSTNNFSQGSIPWNDQLAIHEYRHVQQFNHFNKGVSKLTGILFGEEGYALATNASIPDWFFEGDAVYQETVQTKQGRGRLPLFVNSYPTLWKAGKNYSWMNMRNGSWKDYVPGHYQLGYLLVNYGYEKYGPDFWSRVTADASAFKGIFYPFQKAIKRYTGIDYSTFRKNALAFYRELANKKLSTDPKGSLTIGDTGNILPVNEKYVNNYLFPYQVSEDSLLYLKRTYRHRAAFYLRTGGTEHRLRIKDISTDDHFSYRNGKIVYTAYETDPRWRWRDYSVIKVLDIKSGKQKAITRRSKYFTPDISASGKSIVAVQTGIDGKSELHILDANTGIVQKRIASPGVSMFTDPKFIHEDSVITAVRLAGGRMALSLVDLITGKVEQLTAPGFTVIGYPTIADNKVYFTASYEGMDNIFFLDLGDKKVFKCTGGFHGKYFVNAQSGKLVWSAFSAEGYQLQQAETVTGIPVALEENENAPLTTVFPVAGTYAGNDWLSQVSNRNFPASRYRKTKRLFNFHSWRPYYEDPEFSFSLYGQNVLNTLETELYYLYNHNDRTNAVGFNSVFGGWFPYLGAGLQYTMDRQQLLDEKLRSWDQLDARIGLSIPLSFTSGLSFKNFIAGTDYVFRSDRIKGAAKADFENSNFSYLSHRIIFSQQIETAVQHIFPRLGYAVSVQHRHAITNVKSWQFLSSASLYLPGIASTHGLVLSGSFQQRDTLNILFGNRFAYSRGYNEVYPARMWRGSVNYHLPLVYPDWGFANILYLHRIRANGFFDFTKLYSNNKSITADQRSAGVEIFVDTKWWNQYELSFGLRLARLLDEDLFTGSKKTVFEFILPVSIFPR